MDIEAGVKFHLYPATMGRPTGGFLRIFPNNVKVWYHVVVNVGQKKTFFFL